jgi:hypothetical protein
MFDTDKKVSLYYNCIVFCRPDTFSVRIDKFHNIHYISDLMAASAIVKFDKILLFKWIFGQASREIAVLLEKDNSLGDKRILFLGEISPLRLALPPVIRF